jgi:U-box domain
LGDNADAHGAAAHGAEAVRMCSQVELVVCGMQVCIERWLQQGNRTCPVTGMRLRHLELTPNFALRVAVQVDSMHCMTVKYL